MKKRTTFMAMALSAMLLAPVSTQAQDKQPLVYDFAGLVEDNDLVNLNNRDGFYIYESDYRPDVMRYDFRGYQEYEGEALTAECHVWRRSDRLAGNLVATGLACPNDREMVVDGLAVGSVVKITYDNSQVIDTEKSIIYATGASAGTQVEIDGAAAQAGVTPIASEAEITVKAGSYIGFKVKAGMVIQKIEVSVAVPDYDNATTTNSNFAAEATPTYIQPSNLNYGSPFYVWEREDKADSRRQDFKGYTWAEGLPLPEVCNVWRRQDRIQNNIVDGGLKCPADREMVISGVQAGSVVTITYDASAAAEGAQILWATGATSGTAATVGGVQAENGVTAIASGAEITITATEGGYFGFKVMKNMIISKVVIKNGEETLTYNFAGLKQVNDLNNLNYGSAFYVWERDDKADSRRQDFKGYKDYTGTNLPAECQIWRRQDRLSGNLTDGGLKCPNDREMVISGLAVGSKVKITYDATGAAEGSQEMIWATGATSGTTATVDGQEAVNGQTAIASGAEIVITATEGGYFGFKVKKGMVISNVEILTPGVKLESTVNDFEAAAVKVPVQPANLNGSAAKGQAFYVWEREDKASSYRQDFKGYTWAEGLNLPEECHVWRRSDRIQNNIVLGGLRCPADREMVIDGLENFCNVVITYDATNAAEDSKDIIYATGTGDEPATLATVNGPLAVSGETVIPSGAKIEIKNTEKGYIGIKVKKGMVISKIEINYIQPISTGIESVDAAEQAEQAVYNLQGVRVAKAVKGIYIQNGKKVVVK